MTIFHLTKLIEYPSNLLSASERSVILQMAYRADYRGHIRASQTELAAEVGCSRKTVVNVYRLASSCALISTTKPGRWFFNADVLDKGEGVLNL